MVAIVVLWMSDKHYPTAEVEKRVATLLNRLLQTLTPTATPSASVEDKSTTP